MISIVTAIVGVKNNFSSENDDSSLEGLTHEQQAVAAGSVICETVSTLDVVSELSTLFFLDRTNE
jgi:hypothetical protein